MSGRQAGRQAGVISFFLLIAVCLLCECAHAGSRCCERSWLEDQEGEVGAGQRKFAGLGAAQAWVRTQGGRRPGMQAPEVVEPPLPALLAVAPAGGTWRGRGRGVGVVRVGLAACEARRKQRGASASSSNQTCRTCTGSNAYWHILVKRQGGWVGGGQSCLLEHRCCAPAAPPNRRTLG
jgi:hypothetical protein